MWICIYCTVSAQILYIYVYVIPLLGEFCGMKLHVECNNEYFDEDELLSMEVEDLFDDSKVENSYNVNVVLTKPQTKLYKILQTLSAAGI